MSEPTRGHGGVQAHPSLRRVIGPKLLLLFVVGDILGTGIYALTGEVAGTVGGAAWTAFALSFVVAMLTATSYVELVGKYPQASGAALYTQKAFGIRFLTFMVAFAVMCSGLTSASAAARTFGGDYLQEFISAPTTLVALLFLVVLSLINFRGVSESVKINVVLTLVELSGLFIIIAIGVVALIRGSGEPTNAFEFNPDGNPFGMVVSGAALAFFALVGFEDSVNMAEETTNPQKSFPRALFLGISITGFIYIAVSFVATMLVPIATLEDSDGPLLEVVKVGASWFPLALFSFIALFAVTNSALINLLMASRLVYGMAKQNVIPPVFGSVHPGRRTPWVAIVFTGLLALGLASTSEVDNLGGTTALLLMCVFAVVNVAVLVLRRDRVSHEHYRAPTAGPVIGTIACIYLASPMAERDAQQYVIAAVLLVIGLGLWAATWLAHGRHATTFDPAKFEHDPEQTA